MIMKTDYFEKKLRSIVRLFRNLYVCYLICNAIVTLLQSAIITNDTFAILKSKECIDVFKEIYKYRTKDICTKYSKLERTHIGVS